MRALVISGGGSKGAFAEGIAQYQMKKQNVIMISLLVLRQGVC
jgi:hypothetical protein